VHTNRLRQLGRAFSGVTRLPVPSSATGQLPDVVPALHCAILACVLAGRTNGLRAGYGVGRKGAGQWGCETGIRWPAATPM